MDDVNPELLSMNAKILLNLGRDEEAAGFFEKSLTLDPDRVSSWVLKGVSLANLERHPEALESFIQAIKLDPKDAGTWYYKGRSQIYLGHIDDG